MSDKFFTSIRLERLRSIITDVLFWYYVQDSNHTKGNSAWLASMMDIVKETVHDCIRNNDIDFELLDRLRVESNSLLNSIHSDTGIRYSEPPAVPKIKAFLLVIEKSIENESESSTVDCKRQTQNEEISREDLLVMYKISTQGLDYRINKTNHPKPCRREGRKQWFCTKSVEEWRANEQKRH
jgi:hypothetical protein